MQDKSKFLGDEPIGRLLFKMSTPAIIAMSVLALYNIVDTIFIGRWVGVDGIAGVAISFPIFIIIIGLSQTIGIGCSSLTSIRLGEKRYNKAAEIIGNSLTMNMLIGTALTFAGLFFIDDLLRLFGASATTLPLAKEYTTVILYGAVLTMCAISGNNTIRSLGNSKAAMVSMILGAITNMILDPIFIWYMDMGLSGAAWATVASHAVSILYLSFSFKQYGISSMILSNLKIKDHIIPGEILNIGFPSLIRQTSGSIMLIVLNNSLFFYGGDLAIAAFGIIFRLSSFALMPIFGITQGLQPILGFNYGARKFLRAKESIYLSIKAATVLSLIFFAVSMVFTKHIVMIFTKDPALIDLAIYGTRIIFLALPIIGFQVIGGGLFQSLGKAKPALILNLLRQVIILIPMILILPIFFAQDGIFYAFPLSDILAATITYLYVKKEIDFLNSSLEDY